MRTGYFADTKTGTKVHVVDCTNKPLCGSIIKNKSFQWCANNIMFSYIECKTCKKRAKEILELNLK